MRGRPRSVSDDEIFDAVASVVTEVGPAKLTLAAVGAAAGVTGPALNQRFGSKRALLVAFAGRAADRVPGLFADARARTDDPMEAAVEALVAMAAPMRTRRAVANSLAFLSLDLADDELRAHAVRYVRTTHGELTELVGDRLADELYTTSSGALIMWAIDGTGPVDEWLRTRLWRVCDYFVGSGTTRM